MWLCAVVAGATAACKVQSAMPSSLSRSQFVHGDGRGLLVVVKHQLQHPSHHREHNAVEHGPQETINFEIIVKKPSAQ
ncbi:Uncharacterised protein [Chlamydia trachomatis]|nr:Uncharacterised protein [Chlamydia trachomatis]